jgi:hypothetical protein
MVRPDGHLYPPARVPATSKVRYSFRSGLTPLVLLACLIGPAPTANAQQIVPLVTDQTPLTLSGTFGVPAGAFVDQAGDYAFLGNRSSAIFLRRAGAPSPVRVLQRGDEVPGFPGSRTRSIDALAMNNSGLLAFSVLFHTPAGKVQEVIFTFDGTSLQPVVSSFDIAPGTSGATFGPSLALIGLNDAGDTAVITATTIGNQATSVTFPTTLFIIPGGGAPVRLAGVGDSAPGTGGTLATLAGVALNSRGEVLFSGTISGGAGGSGLFIATAAAGVRKVVANGDTIPSGGTFTSPGTGRLNNLGEVVFDASSALWVNSPLTGTSRAVGAGDEVPLPLGGTFGAPSSPQAFDDAGDIAFTASVSGSAATNLGLFRSGPGNPIDVVAFRNQAAPGVTGSLFSAFSAISMNDTGAISFRADRASGGAIGIFQQSVGDPLVSLVIDGRASPLGGTYRLSGVTPTRTLDTGSVYFSADVPNGSADRGEFLVSPSTTVVLMSTADPLPPGARVTLLNTSFGVGGAGGFVAFTAQHGGSGFSVAVHHIATRTTTVLATEGETVPETGGRLRLSNPGTAYVNANGQVTFQASLIGGPGSAGSRTAILVAGQGGGISKIVVSGDADSAGRILSGIGLNMLLPSPINDAGQVVFRASAQVSGVSRAGVFVGSVGAAPVEVALVGDVTSTGETITACCTGDLSINASGQVAFGATTAAGVGLFVGTAGSTPVKVVSVGDDAPGGGQYSRFHTPGFNSSGEVAFMATVDGGAGGGIFLGSVTSPPVALALNGAPAPAGGNFSLTAVHPDVIINDQHDVVFLAGLTDGTANSGYFMRRGPLGALQTLVLQGDPAPGTTGVFNTFSHGPNDVVGELFQLSSEGDVAFAGKLPGGSSTLLGYWHVRTDGAVEQLLVRGVVAPEFGGGVSVVNSQTSSWNSGGRYPIFARISGGTFTDGIFLFAPPTLTNTPTGTGVVVRPHDAVTGTTPVTLTFSEVTQTGDTTVTTSAGGPALPTAFRLGDPPVFYNLTTTAVFDGSIAVCIDFAGVSFPAGADLRLLHFEGGTWRDVTTSGPTGTVVCGDVASLSPFTVAQFVDRAPVANAGLDQLLEAANPSGAGFTLSSTGSGDPDGDTLSYLWKEGATIVGTTASVSLMRGIGTYTFTLTVTDPYGLSATSTTHVTVTPPPSTAGPANIWLGLKNSDDVGTKFDVLVEILKNGGVVGTGQANGVPGGSSGFNNAVQRVMGVVFNGPTAFGAGDMLGVRLSVRIAMGVSGHRSGTARLWLDDAAANSRWEMVVGGETCTLYLRNGSTLSAAPGTGSKSTVDVFVDRLVGGNAFKPFGTWSIRY